MPSLLAAAAAAVAALSRLAAGARSLEGILGALEAKSGAEARAALAAAGPGQAPDLHTVLETVLHGPPTVMDERATQDALSYCLESGFNCSRAVEWRRRCYEVMGDPITRKPNAAHGKNKLRATEYICRDDPVELGGGGGVQAACKRVYVCLAMRYGPYVPGLDGKKVGDSPVHCGFTEKVRVSDACVPDWQPDSEDPLRNPVGVVEPLPQVELPAKVEEVISEFIPFFWGDASLLTSSTPAPAQAAPTSSTPAPSRAAPIVRVSAGLPGLGLTVHAQVEVPVQPARCVCNSDASRAALVSPVDPLGRTLFVGASGVIRGHAPKLVLGTETPCACTQKFYGRRPWSWFATEDQCTNAPSFWDPVTESTQIWLLQKARNLLGDVTWFEDCLKLCQAPMLLAHVDTACDVPGR